ncbi:MAG: magnesium-translocating P-type ATPase [Fimbriimonas ginsengisoli]|uniref:Magnesium-transporting ATPase, P-type 1 n=1 Tax=Fimbriimonas ginsengisoli TaxID=1005039 RepID=A0A931M1D3_FIMGI|nr:magnesium-translocating P-type ATPase [Fimbriimonas ginsengisoli]
MNAPTEPRPKEAYWSIPADRLAGSLGSSARGLDVGVAASRRQVRAKNKAPGAGAVFLGQFKSPIVLLLLAAAILSGALGDRTDCIVILGIVFLSAALSFHHEFRAGNAVAKLMELVASTATVLRSGKEVQVPLDEVVPGDVVVLRAGALIPGDGVILESSNLFCDEAALTGESFPAEKRAGVTAADAAIAARTNCLFTGTHVVSGFGRMLVAAAGEDTEFGEIAQRLRLAPPETDFEKGIRHLGTLLIELTLILTLGVFAINVAMHRPVLDSFLFALALAVGLTPQLLPAIISVNLSHGAMAMARAKVIVKRLASIENFGSMNLLCSDKTGTITTGIVQLHGALDASGQESAEAKRLACLNASLQTGFQNPIDDALIKLSPDGPRPRVLGEIPYDFVRKRLSVVVEREGGALLIAKGALEPMLDACASVRGAGKTLAAAGERAKLDALFHQFSDQGYRVLGLASREFSTTPSAIGPDLEAELTFEGFLLFEDPLRPEIAGTVKSLHDLGIRLKIITGDNRLVAALMAGRAGLSTNDVLTGADLRALSDHALAARAKRVDVFAEIEPNQKERLILALRRAGFVVGYIGDGINDGSALHSADVGISVSNAVDVAKEAADLVMLDTDLAVLVTAVQEGRRTFANTLKYIFMATSANFGNMFSMAGASLLIPFLPLLPSQILLMNLLTDIPEMTIAQDNVDPELVQRPRKWDMRFLRRFMIVFGPLSSVFDFATFGVLLWFRAEQPVFRTGWFTESIVSAAMIVLVVRSRRPFFRSEPGGGLKWATIGAVAATIALPFTPLAAPLGLKQLPLPLLAVMMAIVGAYMLSAEFAKAWFYRTLSRSMD